MKNWYIKVLQLLLDEYNLCQLDREHIMHLLSHHLPNSSTESAGDRKAAFSNLRT